MEQTQNTATAALAGIPARRVNVWRCRGQEPAPRSGDKWERFSPFHALLLETMAAFIDEHACPPDRAADLVTQATPELLARWHRLPSGLAVILVARRGTGEKVTFSVEVCPAPAVIRDLGTNIVACFGINVTLLLRQIQERAAAAGIALPPLDDKAGWLRAMK